MSVMVLGKKNITSRKAGFTPTPITIGVGSQGERGFIPYESNFFKNKYFTRYLSRNTRDFRTGFTLIEILVVISIIGILSSIVLASVNQSRAKSRDAQLIAGVDALKHALELYYDANGRYPAAVSDGTRNATFTPWYTSIQGDNTDPTLKNALAPHLSQLPNPGMTSVSNFKSGLAISRISYEIPYFAGNITASEGINCGQTIWGQSTGRCYIINIITETDTSFGPADTAISLINGNTKIVSPGDWWWGYY